MSLALYGHPFSSYTQKVLIALYENGTPFEFRCIGPDTPQHAAEWLRRWPLHKFPLLEDGDRNIAETSIIIEHLQRRHAPSGRALIPADPEQALEVRLWDRLFDQYVMTPMQAFTADLLRPEAQRDPLNVAQAREALLKSYALIDRHLQGRRWVAADGFSMADCAAAPALFYAVTYVPLPEDHARLAAYFERLMDRPSVARTVDQARPFFQFYPGRAGLARRFFEPQGR